MRSLPPRCGRIYTQANLSEQDRVMLDFAVRLTQGSVQTHT